MSAPSDGSDKLCHRMRGSKHKWHIWVDIIPAWLVREQLLSPVYHPPNLPTHTNLAAAIERVRFVSFTRMFLQTVRSIAASSRVVHALSYYTLYGDENMRASYPTCFFNFPSMRQRRKDVIFGYVKIIYDHFCTQVRNIQMNFNQSSSRKFQRQIRIFYLKCIISDFYIFMRSNTVKARYFSKRFYKIDYLETNDIKNKTCQDIINRI